MTVEWGTACTYPGDYAIELLLRAMTGEILDQHTIDVTLGSARLGLSNLSATKPL